MDRREFIVGAGIGAAASFFPAAAQTEPSDIVIVSELPPLPPDLINDADKPPASYAEISAVGTAPPSTAEIGTAYDLLVQSPFGGTPVDIAQYFLAVGAGAYGQEYRPFAREWPVRANPMIMHFFSATQTKPEGDTTAWCAAFVNWCLLRAHAASADEIGQSPGGYIKNGKPFSPDNLKKFSTNNASSGSFRCWDAVTSPRRGDITVFRDRGTDSLTPVCRGSGHVAFFLKVPGDGQVQVLGGNQSQAGCNGAVTVANMSTRVGSRFMKYVALKA